MPGLDRPSGQIEAAITDKPWHVRRNPDVRMNHHPSSPRDFAVATDNGRHIGQSTTRQAASNKGGQTRPYLSIIRP